MIIRVSKGRVKKNKDPEGDENRGPEPSVETEWVKKNKDPEGDENAELIELKNSIGGG